MDEKRAALGGKSRKGSPSERELAEGGRDFAPETPEEAELAEAAAGMSHEDWRAAEQARPDLPDENADGLNELEAEVQRRAEDLASGREQEPLDSLLRTSDGREPVEEMEMQENLGSFPELTDQEEEQRDEEEEEEGSRPAAARKGR